MELIKLAFKQCLREGIKNPSNTDIAKRMILIIEWLQKHGKYRSRVAECEDMVF